MVVIRLLIMQAQQIQSVIVAVGRPHDRVNMELCRFVIGQEHAGVMIELDEGHRALYPVVECAVLRGAAIQQKLVFARWRSIFVIFCGARPSGRDQISLRQVRSRAAAISKSLRRKALVGNDTVVLIAAAEMRLSAK